MWAPELFFGRRYLLNRVGLAFGESEKNFLSSLLERTLLYVALLKPVLGVAEKVCLYADTNQMRRFNRR